MEAARRYFALRFQTATTSANRPRAGRTLAVRASGRAFMKRLPPEAALFGIPPNSSPPSLPVGPQNVIQNVLQIRRPRKHIIDFAAENRTKKLVRFPLGAPTAKFAIVIPTKFLIFVPLRFVVGQSMFCFRTVSITSKWVHFFHTFLRLATERKVGPRVCVFGEIQRETASPCRLKSTYLGKPSRS